MRRAVVIVGLLLLLLSGCVYRQSDDGATLYQREMGEILDPVVSATDDWSAVADRHSRVDTRTLSMSEALTMVNELHEVAATLHAEAQEASTKARFLIPPTGCEALHEVIVESVRLTEHGGLEMKGYLETVLRTGEADEQQRRYAMELLAEADRTKLGMVAASRQDGCSIEF